MREMDDKTLLKEYAESGSDAAFETLVARYVNLVYSAALRHVRDAHLAEEVTQAVFVILARKAGSLRGEGALAGWLYKTVRFTASAQLKSMARRQRREQEAFMNPTTNDDTTAWEAMEPMLDEALMRLSDKDRQAVLLRYFQGKQLRDVGEALNANEDAARKRIGRALLRLRDFFIKRGVALSLTAIGGALASHSVQAAPAGLAAHAAAAALLQTTTTAASTAVLANGAMKLMTIAKLKTAAALGTAAILALGAAGVATRVIAQTPPIQDSAAQTPPIQDSAWMRIDTRTLNSLPPAFILRVAENGGGGASARSGNKMMGRAISLQMLMSMAYDIDSARVVLPANAPAERYDLLMTGANASPELLQQEIKKQLGFAAQKRTEPRDVLVLNYKQPAPGLRQSAATNARSSSGGGASSMSSGSASGYAKKGAMTLQGQTIPAFIKNMQGHFALPIVDKTGLDGKFDIALEWTGNEPAAAIVAALPTQLGLELTPSREVIENLIVQKRP